LVKQVTVNNLEIHSTVVTNRSSSPDHS
jgi:hypothetical protein